MLYRVHLAINGVRTLNFSAFINVEYMIQVYSSNSSLLVKIVFFLYPGFDLMCMYFDILSGYFLCAAVNIVGSTIE